MNRTISVYISYHLEKHFSIFHKVLVESTLAYMFDNDEEDTGWWYEKKEDLESYDTWCEINPSLISNLKIKITDIKVGEVSITFNFLCSDSYTYEKFKEGLGSGGEFDIDWVVKENLKPDLDHYFFNGLLKDNDFKELRDICEDCEFKWDVKIV